MFLRDDDGRKKMEKKQMGVQISKNGGEAWIPQAAFWPVSQATKA